MREQVLAAFFKGSIALGSQKPGTEKPGTSMISKSQRETEVPLHLGSPEAGLR
jgi:hypothetical protein